MKDLSKLNKLIRLAQGERTQNEYALHCDISSAAITRICAGQYDPKPPQLKKLASKARNGVTYEMLMDAAGYLESPQMHFLLKEPPIPASHKGVKIPVYGKIAAGIPIEAIEDIIDYEEVSADFAATGQYIALKIDGESMSPEIRHGDVVLIRLQPNIESDEIGAVYVNGHNATLKKIKKELKGIWLVPLNSAYEAKFYSEKECAELPIRILGKMVEVRRKY